MLVHRKFSFRVNIAKNTQKKNKTIINAADNLPFINGAIKIISQQQKQCKRTRETEKEREKTESNLRTEIYRRE